MLRAYRLWLFLVDMVIGHWLFVMDIYTRVIMAMDIGYWAMIIEYWLWLWLFFVAMIIFYGHWLLLLASAFGYWLSIIVIGHCLWLFDY